MQKDLKRLIGYPKDGILSKSVIKSDKLDVTLFCLAKGSEITDHTSTREGFIYVVEGEGTFNLAGEEIAMIPGKFIYLSKNIVHSLSVKSDLTFLLSLCKD